MTFQTDHSKGLAQGNGGGGWGEAPYMWGWKTKNQALLWTFSLMMLSLIMLLAWEGAGPLTGGFPQDAQNIIQFRFGEAGKKHAALLASSEELYGSGERMREVEDSIRKVTTTSEVAVDSDNSSHDDSSARHPEAVTSRVKLTAKTITHPYPTFNLSMSMRNPTETQQQLHPPEPIRPQKSTSSSSSSRNALIIKEDTSEPVDTQLSMDQIERKGSRSKESGEVCDFTKGRWVKDEQLPFYSGKECKAYLAGGFACRNMNRLNFEYEKLRWQPEGCDLPSFTSDGFLHRLRNKVVAFVGDSLGRQQFQSLMCMVTEGKDDKRVEDVQKAWGGDVKWAYRFRPTNTTILFYWSTSLCEIELGNPNEQPGYAAMHLDRPPSFLKHSLHKLDVVVLNTGHHWNRGKLQSNKWHPYVGGKPLTDRKLAGMGYALNFTVHKVVQWLDEKLASTASSSPKQHGQQQHHHHQPAVFFRTLSPRHFQNGDWNSGGTCDSTRAYSEPKTIDNVVVPAKKVQVYKGPITERVAENAVRGTRVNLLNITHLSQFREEGHISKYGIGKDSSHQDCLHWCLPGVPDVWNELLYGSLVADPGFSPLPHDHHR